MQITQTQEEIQRQQIQQQIQQQTQQQGQQQGQQQTQQQGPQQTQQQDPQQTQQQGQLQLNQEVQVYLPPAQADGAAAGVPIQMVVPAKKTYKARRAEKHREREERKQHEREARENTKGVGNIITYEIKQQLVDYHTQQTNSFNNYFPRQKSGNSDMSKNRSGVDPRMLQCFSHGFRTDEAGRPATAEDERYKREDEEFYDAFCSTDYTRRVPYLKRMVEEMLNLDLKENMFSDKSMRSNTAAFKSMADRIAYFENVMKDENNTFFFDSPLSPVKKEDLNKVMDIVALPMVSAFLKTCQKWGVETDDKEVRYVNSREGIAAYSQEAKLFVAQYKRIPREYQRMKDTLKRAQTERLTTETERLNPEVYQQVCSYLEGDIQKILDCDVEKLCELSYEDLLKRREELDKLYSASLGVNKCLPLKHPKKVNIYNEPLTLREDLLGQRRLEYEYKSNVLRGLVERAAGSKIKGKRTIEAASTRYRNQMTPNTPEFLEFFNELQSVNINNKVSFLPPKFADVMRQFIVLPQQENNMRIAEAKRIKETIKQLQREGQADDAEELAENMKKELHEGKIAGVMNRLQQDSYYSLEHTQTELEKKGMGESLFRNFDPFLTYEATQTLLSPEQLEQMLFNLGAGAGLISDLSECEEQLKQAIEKGDVEAQQKLEAKKKDTQEQREEAIKMNNAGLDTLRKVLTAQYDMLERKYGNSLENLTLKELIEHYDDIGRDLTFTQQDENMSLLFPGFIREGNLEDERLFYQIHYYHTCCNGIFGCIPSIALGNIQDVSLREPLKTSDEGFHTYMSNYVSMLEETREARKYLMQDGDSFQHPLDWSQKVRKPGDEDSREQR